MSFNMPKTYQEYGELNEFGETELSDKVAEKYYNKLADLINQFSPIEQSELEKMGIDADLSIYNLEELMDLYVEKNCVSRDVADQLLNLLEYEIYPLGAEFSFLDDIVLETFFE